MREAKVIILGQTAVGLLLQRLPAVALSSAEQGFSILDFNCSLLLPRDWRHAFHRAGPRHPTNGLGQAELPALADFAAYRCDRSFIAPPFAQPGARVEKLTELCQIARVSGFELNRWRLVAGTRRDHERPSGVDNVICLDRVRTRPDWLFGNNKGKGSGSVLPSLARIAQRAVKDLINGNPIRASYC
jgi:hypothetical protein